MMDFLQMLTGQAPAVPTTTQPWAGPENIQQTPLAPNPGMANPGAQMAQVMEPAPQPTPPATPEEFEARKAGWLKTLLNPNLFRALGYAGSVLMQPIAPGQTKMGNVGRAFNVGRTAYELGEVAQSEADLAAAEEKRKQELHGPTVKKAGAEATVAEATVESRITEAKTKAEQAKFNLDKAQKVEEVEAIERELKKEKALLEKGIPDEVKRKAIIAEYEAAGLKAKEARARINASNAAAGASGARTKLADAQARGAGAEADIKERERKMIAGMSNEEFAQYQTKTGKYKATTSTWDSQIETYKQIYDAETAEGKKTDAGRQAFVKKMITKQNFTTLSATVARLAAQGILEDHPELGAELLRMLQESIPGKASEGAAGAVPGVKPSAGQQDMQSAIKAAGWAYEPDKYDYRIVNGVPQRKAKGK